MKLLQVEKVRITGAAKKITGLLISYGIIPVD